MKSHKLLIAGGGTGGHVLAGVAIADAWKKKYPNAEILFVGSDQGLEARLVPKSGYPLKLLPVGALNRVDFWTRIKTFWNLPISFVRAFFIILNFKPLAVLGVGGYASGPVVLVASFLSPFLGLKTAILEQNLVSGFTNRWLGRFVNKVFCAFDEAHDNFPKGKASTTGNPIRSSLKECGPIITSPFTVFIFGGSQGALPVNTMILAALPFLKNENIKIIHQTGAKDFERTSQGYQRIGFPDARVESFIDDMQSCYEQASLIICRAGASTMAELSAVGRGAIFIPLPTAADNHQEKNARVYERAEAAIVLKQASLGGEDFAKMILSFRADPIKMQKMAQNVRRFYKPNAANDVVELLST